MAEGWYMYDGSQRDVLVSRYGSGCPNQFNHIVDPGGRSTITLMALVLVVVMRLGCIW